MGCKIYWLSTFFFKCYRRIRLAMFTYKIQGHVRLRFTAAVGCSAAPATARLVATAFSYTLPVPLHPGSDTTNQFCNFPRDVFEIESDILTHDSNWNCQHDDNVTLFCFVLLSSRTRMNNSRNSNIWLPRRNNIWLGWRCQHVGNSNSDQVS